MVPPRIILNHIYATKASLLRLLWQTLKERSQPNPKKEIVTLVFRQEGCLLRRSQFHQLRQSTKEEHFNTSSSTPNGSKYIGQTNKPKSFEPTRMAPRLSSRLRKATEFNTPGVVMWRIQRTNKYVYVRACVCVMEMKIHQW